MPVRKSLYEELANQELAKKDVDECGKDRYEEVQLIRRFNRR